MEDIILDEPDLIADLELATPLQRFLNFAIDQAVIYVLSLAVRFFILNVSWLLMQLSPMGRTMFSVTFQLLILLLYYAVMENSLGKTVAKMVTNTRVINKSGEQPDFRAIALRTICRLIPFEAFSFLGKAPGWHDSLSKTLVIQDRK